jgi:uncharacterized protein (TIGR01777 family)
MNSTEIILITGGSGMIAQYLSCLLEKNGYEVRFFSRTKKSDKHFVWNIKTGFIDVKALENVDHIIHLAGANISTKRWTKARKKNIIESRTKSTQLLFDTVKKHQIKIKTFIATSAVGYYGTSNNDVLYNEESPAGTDFLANVCTLWENVSKNFSLVNSKRLLTLRLGVVLSKNGGALEKMKKPIKLGLGTVLGSGKQYMPWIHIDDLCQFILYSLRNKGINGTYNLVAPEHINNSDFTSILAKRLGKKVWLPNLPALILRLLLGDMASILLNGNRVSSEKLLSIGFKFKYPTVTKALANLIE